MTNNGYQAKVLLMNATITHLTLFFWGNFAVTQRSLNFRGLLGGLVVLGVTMGSTDAVHAAQVFFNQAVNASGGAQGNIGPQAELPEYAPIRDGASGPILGYVGVTLTDQLGQLPTLPSSDGTDTIFYEAVAVGDDKFAVFDFSFWTADLSGTPRPNLSQPLLVDGLLFRVSGDRGFSGGGGFVTPDESDTATLHNPGATWTLTGPAIGVIFSITGPVLTYTGSVGPGMGATWQASNTTGFTWRLDNNSGINPNGTQFTLDLSAATVSAIPAPATASLVVIGLAGLRLVRRRR